MASQISYVPYVSGAWVQLCELRPGRQSLTVDTQNASLMLAFRTVTGTSPGPFGDAPPGILIIPQTTAGRDVFKICVDCDGDSTEQAWFGWAIPSTITPPATGIVTFTANGTWLCPAGVTSVDLNGVGACGGAVAATPFAGPSNGGGGGAFAQTLAFTVIPGHTYTIQCWPGGAAGMAGKPPDTWFSGTGVAPIVVGDGILAQSGANGQQAAGGAQTLGGKAINSIAVTLKDGGDSGSCPAFVQINGGSSSGGGGTASATAAGLAGGNGRSGSFPGGVGGTPAGGAGGASDGSASTTGIGTGTGAGGGSAVTGGGFSGGVVPTAAGWLTVRFGTAQGPNVVTVIESYAEPAVVGTRTNPNPYSPLVEPLPPIEPRIANLIRQFMARLCKE